MSTSSVDVINDIVQELGDRTAIASPVAHVSSNLNAAMDSTQYFRKVGTINPGSPNFDFKKDIVDVVTGSPGTIKSRHITSYGGSMQFEIVDYNDLAFRLAVGTQIEPSYVPATGSNAFLATVLVSATTMACTLSWTTDPISNKDLAPGHRLSFPQSSGVNSWTEVKPVLEVDTITDQVYLDGELSHAPLNGDLVEIISRVDIIIGGNRLKNFQLRLIVSFDDGSFVLLHSPRGNFIEAINPKYEDGKNYIKLGLNFGLIGRSVTMPGETLKQVKLAEHRSYYPV